MFALGGDSFPNDTQSLRAALTDGAKPHGAGEGAVSLEGNFPSLDALRMNLTGVRLDSATALAAAAGNASVGFFSRTLDVTAEPAMLATVPIRLRLHAEDCVFAFAITENGSRAVRLDRCSGGTLDAAAATVEIEAALLALARDAASARGAEVQSVRLTLTAESPRRIAVNAVAVAKAMFFTATLTIRGSIELDDEFNLRLINATCAGDGMIANLAAAQFRPRLAELEKRVFSLRAFLPAGVRATGVELTGGDALQIRATLAGG
ncbi:MAG: hypothetical protein ABI318_08335 [Chthoniobacteraceae bacterium]